MVAWTCLLVAVLQAFELPLKALASLDCLRRHHQLLRKAAQEHFSVNVLQGSSDVLEERYVLIRKLEVQRWRNEVVRGRVRGTCLESAPAPVAAAAGP